MPRKVYRATAEIRLPGEKHKITVDGVEGEMDATDDFIADDVYLSNKSCRHCYMNRTATGSACPCPPGRCWYQEQQTRRADKLQAITPKAWLAAAREGADDSTR